MQATAVVREILQRTVQEIGLTSAVVVAVKEMNTLIDNNKVFLLDVYRESVRVILYFFVFIYIFFTTQNIIQIFATK